MNDASNLEVEIWPIEQLIPYERNAKKHPKEQVQKIANSIQEFGWPKAKAIEVEPDGTVINGHGRRLAALQLKMAKVPVVVRSDLTDAQIKAYRLADNEVSHSEYDTGLLSDELSDIIGSDDSLDMSMFFDTRDLDFATDDLGEMDLDALTEDIQEEVEQSRDAAAKKVAAGKQDVFEVHKVLGFKKVNNDQRMVLHRLLSVAESTTGKDGVDALVDYVEEHCL